MKQELIQEIVNNLSSIGVRTEAGGKTDLSINEELLDAASPPEKRRFAMRR
ncbi:MAG: hypothetical protein VB034_13355 [Eubacteriales bacterium]|nr:hypothetical protein [Eubacteriales bacterium]